jgi:hypothetical protein
LEAGVLQIPLTRALQRQLARFRMSAWRGQACLQWVGCASSSPCEADGGAAFRGLRHRRLPSGSFGDSATPRAAADYFGSASAPVVASVGFRARGSQVMAASRGSPKSPIAALGVVCLWRERQLTGAVANSHYRPSADRGDWQLYGGSTAFWDAAAGCGVRLAADGRKLPHFELPSPVATSPLRQRAGVVPLHRRNARMNDRASA